jgi:uroporphyrinogen-III synthase
MLVKEKRETKRERKRERILESAAELFSHKNYHEVMMEEVAKLTDIAKGTVYNYFASKEELYFSIMKIRMENLINSVREKISNESNSINSLHSFITHLYMFMMKYQSFFLIYQKESLDSANLFCDELRDLESQLRSLLTGIIRKGIQENLFRTVEEKFSVSLILGSIYGSVQRGINQNHSNDQIINEREMVFEFVLHGLYSGFKNNEVLPLKDKTIVLTRSLEQSKESADALAKLGANVIVFPTLEIVSPTSWDQFDEIVKGNNEIDYIIFTSAHAVRMFSKRCSEINVIINYNRIKVVAVGNKTSSVCSKFGIPVHIIPDEFSASGVIQKLSGYELKNKTVLIPRSAIGREELPKGLKDRGAIIKSVAVYNVTIPSGESMEIGRKQIEQNKTDLFVFTSPSTFENFLQILKIDHPFEYFRNRIVAAIGPTTKSAIENHKVKVNIMPNEYTIDGLVEKIVDHFNQL